MDKDDIKRETEKIWKAINNLDKADIQTTALCHAIVTLLIDKGIVTQQQTAEELGKSIPKVLKLRQEIEASTSEPASIWDKLEVTKTVQ